MARTRRFIALTPHWAHLPEGGAGAAAVVGGRFNRPGVEARYRAETIEGAVSEYQQESELLPPATLATYLVTADQVVDFSGWYNPEKWSPLWAEAYRNWKGLVFLEGIEPPSWAIGDLVRANGTTFNQFIATAVEVKLAKVNVGRAGGATGCIVRRHGERVRPSCADTSDRNRHLRL